MNTKHHRQIALRLDHASSDLFAFNNGNAVKVEQIESPYVRIKREDGQGNDHARFGSDPHFTSSNENRKNNTLQNELESYFKLMESKLSESDEILLFGSSKAKEKLFNRLSKNKHFQSKIITVKSVDKMTERQELAYVREFYSGQV
jgi:hypothetical protein